MNTHKLAPGLSRRTLLGSSAALTAATLARPAKAARGTLAKPVLVQIFLRFGMDGLTMVVPYADGDLYNLRPRLAIRPPGSGSGARDLDGFFGLAPAAAPLLTPYGNGHLAIVHACGSSDATRSHFEAFERMEFGDLPMGVPVSGWAARYLQATQGSTISPLRGVALGDFLPLTLSEAPRTLPMRNFLGAFPGDPDTAALRRSLLMQTYARRRAEIAAAAHDTFSALGFADIDFATYMPENGAQYPASELGQQLRDSAAVIKAESGVEVISIDYGNWDLHANLGPIDGEMARLMDDLTRALEAFYLDLLGHLDDYVLVCLSEFGRHALENGSEGVDHGHGNAMFVLGNVNGGQVIANWPGLSSDALDNDDLAITIDYRDILAEVLVERLGLTDPAAVFPGHTFTSHGVVS